MKRLGLGRKARSHSGVLDVTVRTDTKRSFCDLGSCVVHHCDSCGWPVNVCHCLHMRDTLTQRPGRGKGFTPTLFC